MAEVETSFVDHLKATSSIAAQVGTRVYEWEPSSAAKKPYIVVTNPTSARGSWTQTIYGGIARISIYVYADTVAKCRTIGNLILDLYKQHTGALDDVTIEQVEVSNARVLWGPGTEFRFLVDLVAHWH